MLMNGKSVLDAEAGGIPYDDDAHPSLSARADDVAGFGHNPQLPRDWSLLATVVINREKSTLQQPRHQPTGFVLIQCRRELPLVLERLLPAEVHTLRHPLGDPLDRLLNGSPVCVRLGQIDEPCPHGQGKERHREGSSCPGLRQFAPGGRVAVRALSASRSDRASVNPAPFDTCWHNAFRESCGFAS